MVESQTVNGPANQMCQPVRIPIPENGVYRTAFPDGKPEQEYSIKQGERHGIYHRWHPNGVLAEESRYQNGLLHGEMRRWNRRGALLGSCRFEKGTGIFREWHENGQVSYEWSFFHGKLSGRMRIWAEDGMLYGQRYYFDGRPISKKCYRAKCRTIPGLPRFEDERIFNTLGNYVRRLRKARREHAKLGPTPEQLEEERWFDRECKAEARQKVSKELISWLRPRAKQERQLGELSRSEALRLARKLYGLGAAKIWATQIERDEDGGQYSKKLIIALPNDAAQRNKIYQVCADPARPFIGGSAPAIRVGQSFMSAFLM